jgi:hypothetical protein
VQPTALNSNRSSNLSKRLYKALCETSIRVPETDESEPSFTRTVLAPVIRIEVDQLLGVGLQFRGDGGDSQAVPASALDVDFYPDLAVSLGRQHLWAAEVKILRDKNRQNAIATALGQATLYRTRYEHVLVVLVDLSPVSRARQKELVENARRMGIRVALRTRAGKSLLKQIGH